MGAIDAQRKTWSIPGRWPGAWPGLPGHDHRPWPTLERHALALANHARLPQLGPSAQLIRHHGAADAALAHSLDQLGRGYFSHYSPEGEGVADRLQRLGVSYQLAGENIGWLRGAGGFTWANIAQLHRGLMDSPGHRANLLERRFRFMGVGIAVGADEMYLTQVFLG